MKTDEMQKILVCVLIFAAIVFAYAFFRLKSDSGLYTYDEYKYILKSDSIVTDNYSGASIEKNMLDPLSIILAFTYNYRVWMRLFPFIFVVINLIFIYSIFKRAHLSDEHLLYSMIYILLSPLFFYVHTTFNMALFLLPLILAGMLLFLDNRPFFGLMLFLLALWVNPWSFFIIAAFLLYTLQRLRETKKGFEIFAMLIIVLIFLFLKGFSFPVSEDILQIGKEYITDIGAGFGLGLFGIITTTIGIILYLRHKDRENAQIFIIPLLLFFSIYDRFFLVFLDLSFAYFSGFAIQKIIHGNWESGILKNYVTLLIFCGLVFSCGSYLNKSFSVGADYGERISIDWIRANLPEGQILSHYEFGYFLSTSGKPVFIDKDYYLNSKEKLKINEANGIFASRDLKNITAFLNRNSIRYIWINKAMKEYLVWTKNDEGMLFVLENSARFKKRYDHLGVEIWEFIQPSSKA